jgi:hypothetical protein
MEAQAEVVARNTARSNRALEAQTALLNSPDQSWAPLPVPGTLAEEFQAGVQSGIEGLRADALYFKGLLNTLVGNEGQAAADIKNARLAEESAAAPLENMQSFGEFLDEPTFSGFISQVTRGTGQILPSAALSIASAGTGSLVAVAGQGVLNSVNREVAKRIIRDSVTRTARGTASDVEKEIAEQAYASLRRAAKVGGLTGAFGAEYVPLSGSNLSEALDSGYLLDPESATRAALVGVPQAAIGAGSEYALLKLIGKQASVRAAKEGSLFANFAKRVGSGGLRGGAIEGSTELAQESIAVANRADLDPLFTAEEAQMRLAESAFLGFFGGAAPGAAGGAFGSTLDAAVRVPDAARGAMDKAKSMLSAAREQRVNQQVNNEQFGDLLSGVTSPESERDIEAQIRAMKDTTSSKRAVWVAGNEPRYNAGPNEIKYIRFADSDKISYAAFVPGRGTIISDDKELVREVIAAGASDQALQIALGYSAVKQASEPGDIVVQALDAAGNIVSEEATTDAGVSAAFEAARKLMPENGSVRQTTVEKALEDRRRRVQQDQRLEVRDMDADEEDAYVRAAEAYDESLNPANWPHHLVNTDGDIVETNVDELDPANRKSNEDLDTNLEADDLNVDNANRDPLDAFVESITEREGQRVDVRFNGTGRKADPTAVYPNTFSVRELYERAFGPQNWRDGRLNRMSEALLKTAAEEQLANPNSVVSIENTDNGFKIVRDESPDTELIPFQLERTVNGVKQRESVLLGLGEFLARSIARANRVLGNPSKSAVDASLRRVFVVTPDNQRIPIALWDLINSGRGLLKARGKTLTKTEMAVNGKRELVTNPRGAAKNALQEIIGDLMLEGYQVELRSRDGKQVHMLTGQRGPTLNNGKRNTPYRVRVIDQNDKDPFGSVYDVTVNDQEALDRAEVEAKRLIKASDKNLRLEITRIPTKQFMQTSNTNSMFGQVLPDWALDTIEAWQNGGAKFTLRQLLQTEETIESEYKLNVYSAQVFQSDEGIEAFTEEMTMHRVQLLGKDGRPILDSNGDPLMDVTVDDPTALNQAQAKAGKLFEATEGSRVKVTELPVRRIKRTVSASNTSPESISAAEQEYFGNKPLFEFRGTPALLEARRKDYEARGYVTAYEKLPDTVDSEPEYSGVPPVPGDTLVEQMGNQNPLSSENTMDRSTVSGVTPRARDLPAPVDPVGIALSPQARPAVEPAGVAGMSESVVPMVRAVLQDLLTILKFKDPPKIYTLTELQAMSRAELEAAFPKGLAAVRLSMKRLAESRSLLGQHISGEFGKVIIYKPSNNPLRDTLVLAHELGHSLYKEERDRSLANKELRDRLMKAYRKSSTFASLSRKYGVEGGFEEWFSDQVALWASKRYRTRQSKSMTEKFFKDFVARLRGLYDALSRSFQKRFKQKVSGDFSTYMTDVLKSRREQAENNGLSYMEKSMVYKFDEMSVSAGSAQRAAVMAGKLNAFLKSPNMLDFTKVWRTADGVLRMFSPAIADMMYVQSQDPDGGGRQGFLGARADAFRKWKEEWGKIMPPTLDQATREQALLEARNTSIPTAQLQGKALEIRQYLERIHSEYIAPSNTNIRRLPNYFPTVFDLEAIANDPDGFRTVLLQADPSLDPAAVDAAIKAMKNIQEAIDDDVQPAVSPTDPSGQVEKALLLTKNILDKNKLGQFLLDPELSMLKYVSHVTRRVEWNRHTQGVDSNGKRSSRLLTELQKLSPRDRAEVENILNIYLGRQSEPLSPFWKKLNSWGQFLQFILLLPFATLSSLTDLAGPVIASKEFSSITEAFKEIASQIKNRDEAARFARDIGLTTSASMANVWVSDAEAEYMDPKARDLTDKFFTYIGLNWFTRFTREFSAGMAVRFIMKHADNQTGNPNSDRYLAELGLTQADVQNWVNGGRDMTSPAGQKMSNAVRRFVQSSVLSPNAAERPTWASDPHWALVWQLKGYFYSMGKVIVGGVKRELISKLQTGAAANNKAMMTAAAYSIALPIVALMPLAMLGLELREYAKYGLAALLPGVEADQRFFKTDRMDWPEYLGETFNRTGLHGAMAIITSANQSGEWGQSPLFSLLGPTAETLDVAMTNGWRVDKTVGDRLLPLYTLL